MTVRVAIIGAGSIGVKHAQAALAAGAELGCIVDKDADRARAVAEECGAAHSSDIQAVLCDPAIQAVAIGVPNCYHKDLAIAALRAGKDVLLEKPMALNQAECEEINDAVRSTGQVLQLGFVHRYTGVGRLAKSIAAAGKLGDIYHAKAHLHFRRGVPGLGKWFTTKRLSGGGALIDVGVHLLDLSLHVLDFPPVESVHGQVHAKFGSRMDGYVYQQMWAGPPNHAGIFDVEDSAHALIRFENGATLDLQVAWAGNFPEVNVPLSMMGFFGDRGGITFELFGDHVNHSFERDGAVVDVRLPVEETDAFRDQFVDFLTGICTRRVHGPTGEQGQIVHSIVDAVYQTSVTAGDAVAR